MKKYVAMLITFCCLVMAACAQQEAQPMDVPNPEVTMTFTDGSTIKLELYPSVAPNTVANFVNLIESGFYNGLTIHRVEAGFVIQGGDPMANGTGGPGYTIKGEFAANGFDNDLGHTRGVLSMARGADNNSAGSQFFIMHGNAAYLDGQYAAFGKIIGPDTPDNESYVTLDRIANTAVDAAKRPQIQYTIDTMTVDTKGYKYTVVKYEE